LHRPRCCTLRANLRLLVDSFAPAHLTLRAARGSLPSGFPSRLVLQASQPFGSRPVKIGLNPAPSAISAPTLPRIVIDPASGLINPFSIFNSVVLIRAFPRRLIRKLPNLLLLRSCLMAVFLDLS
jgi:hypothetical protein